MGDLLTVRTASDVRTFFSGMKKRLRTRKPMRIVLVEQSDPEKRWTWNSNVMVARRLAHLVPPPREKDHGLLAILYRGRESFDRRPPFRAPHYTVSRAGLFGGGSRGILYPGEVSLAHAGTLLLDEVIEFDKSMVKELLAVLRQKNVVLHSGGESAKLPASPALVIAGIKKSNVSFEKVRNGYVISALDPELVVDFDLDDVDASKMILSYEVV